MVAEERPARGPARWPLRTRLRSLLGAAGLLLAATLVTQLVLQAQQRDVRNDLLNRIDPARVTVANLRAAVIDQESGLRGYVLTRDEQFLDPYERGRAAGDATLERLGEEFAGDEQVEGSLEEVEDRLESWRTEVAVPALAGVGQEGPRASAASDVEAKQLFDDLRASINAVDRELGEIRRDARDDLDQAATSATIAMFLQVVGLVASGLLIAGALARLVTGPLSRLGRDARVVADGDLGHEVRGEGSPDLVRLGADVDAMRRRILAEVDQLNVATADLADQAEELARSNDDLEQFAYVASHDLQEPLRKVSGFCQLLQMRYADQLDERANEYIHFAVDGAKRMQDLINDLLTFSRVGRTSESFEPVDLDDVASGVVEVLGPAIEDAGATVTVSDLPVVAGDRRLLAATFQNLIGNALKFRRPDAPVVTVEATLTDGAAGDEWVITVADNGIGVDPEYGEQIFTIFKRLHSKSEYAGTGIGLALAKKIVEFHGGRIWLESTPGPGATFKLALPAAPGSHPAQKESADAG
jgi:signal transduction histidine kinase